MSQPSTPQAPDLGKAYKQGIQTFLQFLPKMLRQEQLARTTYDPRRIREQQALQAEFGPTQYAQQLQALQQLDPTGVALRNLLGGDISKDLARGYINPQQNAAFGQLGDMVSNYLQQGALDPTQKAAYGQLGQFAMNALKQGGLSPEQAANYRQLAGVTSGDLSLGTSQSPAALRQERQYARAGQSARGNAYGNAPISAETLFQGQKGEQLYQQRIGNMQNFLGLQNPAAQAAQLALGFGQLPPPEAAALQAGMGYYGLQSPQEKTYAQAGSFLSSPTPEQQIQAIQGVTPDRSFAYVNPNAGYLGQQGALANYPNQFAGMGSSNPWMNALSGSASGAAQGTMMGGWPYGTVIGGITGALGGYFSDRQMKTGIKKVGRLDIYSYKYKPQFGIPGRFRGAMSRDIKKIAPDKVHQVNGMDFVEAGSGVPQFREEEE